MSNHRRILVFLWIAFVLRGLFYSSIFPIWEGYDEPFHFAYLQQLAHNGKIPGAATPVSREVQQSLHELPLPWTITQEQLPQPILVHDDYWKLPLAERQRLQKQFQEMPASWAQEDANESIGNYEVQQAPLYYFLFYFPLKWMSGLSLAARVLLLRFFNILLASCMVPLGYRVAHSVLKSANLALSVAVFTAVLPELFVDLARVGNEALALVLYTLVFYLAVKVVEGPQNFKYLFWLGASLGLGLLTKAYFLTAIPALFLILVWCVWRWPQARINLLKNAALAGAALGTIAGPWYWRVHKLTGSWSGISYDVALHSMSRWQMLTEVPRVNWTGGMISILLSHVWFGGWSFLKFSKPVYLVFGSIILAAILGMGRIAWFHVQKFHRQKNEVVANEWKQASTGSLLVLLSFYGFFWLGLGYDLLITYISTGFSASTGWYMYALIVAEVILLYLGLSAIVPQKLSSWILPVSTSLFAILDLYGLHFLLVPYYTGVISHVGQNRVAAAGIGQLVHTGIAEFAQRLSVNKPTFLGATEIIALWIIFLLATVSLIFTGFRLRKAGDARSE